ncbi:MAG: SoxR reducing system RseC family protein [Bacteroidales bacterium]|jgi:sigma-E factor negative regulatory protein RseC|nr:SoxR reducing system RseC family protein [Bacteroidales bacterium]
MKKVKHSGTIVNIDKNTVSVEIISLSACASCKSKSLCQMSESKEKQIEVSVSNPESYSVGQSVNIVMQEQLGLKAVFLAYVMPFLVCITALFGLSLIFDSELIYGGGAVFAAAFYYLGLKQFSNKLAKEFVWYLE